MHLYPDWVLLVDDTRCLLNDVTETVPIINDRASM